MIGPFAPLDARARARSLRETLAAAPDRSDIWVFAYASLIWRPCFESDAKRRFYLPGYQRTFCVWTVQARRATRVPGTRPGAGGGRSRLRRGGLAASTSPTERVASGLVVARDADRHLFPVLASWKGRGRRLQDRPRFRCRPPPPAVCEWPRRRRARHLHRLRPRRTRILPRVPRTERIGPASGRHCGSLSGRHDGQGTGRSGSWM